MKLFKVLATSFENFDQTVRSYLSKTLGSIGRQYSESQIFGTIFEGIKGVMQNVMFYIEDAFNEQNIDTAFRKTSVYSLAKLSGYEPFYGSAAVGILNCNINLGASLSPGATKIYIKNKSKLVNRNTGLTYNVILPTDYYVIDITKPLVPYQIKIIQGNWKNTAYSAKGLPLEALHITTSSVYDKEYIEVMVDGVKYSRAASIYDMSEDSLEYVVSVGYDNELDIIFGNGIHGKQLQENQFIDITYLAHSGIAGNVALSDDYEFKFSTALYDSNGEAVSDVSFINLTLSTHISGGTNAETVEDVRQMIGYNSRSLVLATEDNFKLFFKRFSFIGHSNIWCDSNSLNINCICLSNYKNVIKEPEEYFDIFRNNKLLLSRKEKEMVVNTLNNSNKAYAGVILNFVDPIVYKYGIIAYVKLADTYDKDTVKTAINTCIANYFINTPVNTNFIAKSDIIKNLLDNISEIEAIDISFISDNNELAKRNGYYYKYEMVESNGNLEYVKTKKQYNKNILLGLDEFGNISIESKFEIPIISNGISYTLDGNTTSNSISNLPAIQVFFV